MVDPGASPAAACPGENLLSAFAAGDLLAEERDAVTHHVAGCETCQLSVAAVATELGNRPVRLRPRGRPLLVWRTPVGRVAAAAAVVVGLGVTLFLVFRGSDRPGSTDEDLAEAARALARARPDLFAGFSPLTREERAAGKVTLRAGEEALRPLQPAGRVLEPRPRFRWSGDPSLGDWTVSLRRADGTPLWSARPAEPSLDWPAGEGPLEPGGEYWWEVAGAGLDGRERAERYFEVATAAERTAFEASVGEIRRSRSPLLSALLEAHLALRRGFLARAEEAARAAVEAAPSDAVAKETLARVLREVGVGD